MVAGDFVVGVASALVAGDRVSVPLRVATISVFSVITQTYAVTATSPPTNTTTRHLSYLILSLSGCRVRCMCVTVFAFGFRRLQTRGNPEAQEDAPAAPRGLCGGSRLVHGALTVCASLGVVSTSLPDRRSALSPSWPEHSARNLSDTTDAVYYHPLGQREVSGGSWVVVPSGTRCPTSQLWTGGPFSLL